MNLDLIPNGTIKRVHVSQNDVGRTLTFELFNNSTSYEVPSGATVKIQGTKPSGFGFSETCTVSGNVVTVDTTEEMTDEFGYIDTELQITYSGNTIGTSNFILAVERNPHPDNTTDGTQITAQSLEVRIEALEESALGGLTDEAKQALLNCFAHVAWIDEHGQDYYDALEDALYPPIPATAISLNSNALSFATLNTTQILTATLTPSDTTDTVSWSSSDTSIATVSSSGLVTSVAYGSCTITATAGSVSATCSVVVAQASVTSISVVYTQSGTVYDTDSLDDLKTDLVVTAHYSDSTTQTVSDYTLSGTLIEGTSVITVAYDTKTTTFNVTVTELDLTLPSGYTAYDFVSNYSPATSSTTNRAQILDTGLSGLYCAPNYEHELDVKLASNTNSNTNYAMYGVRVGTSGYDQARLYFIKTNSGTYNTISPYYNGEVVWDSYSLSVGQRYDIVSKNKQIIVNGDVVFDDMYVETYNYPSTGNIGIWGCYTSGSSASALTNIMKVYKFAVRDTTTGTYVAYMIPCKDGSDVSGLYDVIRETFYTASTASKLLAENDA